MTKIIDHVNNLCVVLDGNVDAKFKVEANIAGEVSSPDITLFQVGIPGLSFPGYVAACPRSYIMDNISRLIVASLILAPNSKYRAT
jgi:hypothetical protein